MTVSAAPTAELDLYLQEPPIPITPVPPHFDVLAWWKANRERFPCLSNLARTALMAPMT